MTWFLKVKKISAMLLECCSNWSRLITLCKNVTLFLSCRVCTLRGSDCLYKMTTRVRFCLSTDPLRVFTIRGSVDTHRGSVDKQNLTRVMVFFFRHQSEHYLIRKQIIDNIIINDILCIRQNIITYLCVVLQILLRDVICRVAAMSYDYSFYCFR